MICLKLPWPPSVNRYWRNVKGRTLISRDGRAYRKHIQQLMLERGGREMLTGRLAVTIHAYPPDRRKRDLDNILKALLDALQHAGVYEDDSQVDILQVFMADIVDDGEISIRIEELVG